MSMPNPKHLKRITRAAVDLAGGPIVVGDALGMTRQAVAKWAVVPPHHVLRIEKMSGVSRYRLRPDIYGDDPSLENPSMRPEFRPAA